MDSHNSESASDNNSSKKYSNHASPRKFSGSQNSKRIVDFSSDSDDSTHGSADKLMMLKKRKLVIKKTIRIDSSSESNDLPRKKIRKKLDFKPAELVTFLLFFKHLMYFFISG